MGNELKTEVVVLGGGPAGYSAAFRCADLGLKTLLIERYPTLGGVCLNVGCIPSKTLLHIARTLEEARAIATQGILFEEPKVDLQQLHAWKERVVKQLTQGLSTMAKTRQVTLVEGVGTFTGAHTLLVQNQQKQQQTSIVFEQAVIAAGSRSLRLPFLPYADSRIWDSTDALQLRYIPKRMLVIGGGIIGLEMAIVYHALGAQIDVVETANQLISAADEDVVARLTKQLANKFNIFLETQVVGAQPLSEAIEITFSGKAAITQPKNYDAVLVAVGRTPNGKEVGASAAGVTVDAQGFICVDQQQRTNVPHIFAIGDIVGQPMLAHKGIHEGHVAAEVIAGKTRYFDPKVIPAIAYTEPELAWVGLTEKAAAAEGIAVEVSTFPWSACGRAIASGSPHGMTKLVVDARTRRIVGGAVVGSNGGELLGEIALAIEMGCDIEDVALTIHAHPTLYESIGLAAELCEGTITDLPNPKAKRHA